MTLRRKLVRNLAVAISCVACSVVGCDSGPALVPVTGSVTVAGKPLAGGRILFEPISAGGSTHSAFGDVAEDGTFELFTHEEGDGVEPGSYYPVVMGPKEEDDAPRTQKPQIGVLQLPDRRLEVTADGPNEFAVSISPQELRGAIQDD